ncbi:MAG: hypothetical protein ACI9YH_000360 [Colwellia sp.]|jgi:hypothetical protein
MLDALMNLIPFALSLETNVLVDVADVQSGKKCGCVCPSCSIPLIAKKGEIIEWHFSHDSKFIEKDQELSCDFSWVVAVKMMIKQLLLEGNTLALPEYFITYREAGYQKPERQLKVANSSVIQYSNPKLKSLACDVTIEVKGKCLGIKLLTKYSPSFAEESFEQALFGVLGISIENVGFDNEGKVVNHLRKYLQLLLQSKLSAKYWLYHRRKKAVIIDAEEQDRLLKEAADFIKATEQQKFLREKAINKPKKRDVEIKKPVIPLNNMQWYCVSCKFEYQGYSTGLNPCPKCDSHFYRKPMYGFN